MGRFNGAAKVELSCDEDLARRGIYDLDENCKPVRLKRQQVRESEFFPASVLDTRPVPPRHWLIPDLIPGGTVTMLGGDGGTGKSLIALQLAVAVASGRQWLRREVATGRAMFISAEDDEPELHRRLAGIVAAEGMEFADLYDLTMRSLAGEDALLATVDPKTKALAPTNLWLELEAQVAEERPALVVLDTLADLHSGEENIVLGVFFAL